MSLRSAIVIVVDRLGAAYLGPYGNTWLDTPAFNALASGSLVCETVLAESPILEETYRSYWESLRATFGGGVSTALVTDEPLIAEHSLAAGFGHKIIVPAEAADHCAEDIGVTGMARLFAAAAEAVASLTPPYLLWVHAQGLAGPWDAPQELREQFRDEEDPQAGAFATPPQMRIDKEFDPDELLKLTHAYAGQVSLLDSQLAAILDMVAARNEPETLLAVTSPRGYPLGEHRRVGACDDALYGELLHVPLLVQFPGNRAAPARTQAILQPADIATLLAEHFGLPLEVPSILWQIARNENHLPREMALSHADQQRAIRTPAWFLRQSLRDGHAQHELFAKPDDRFEVNEVSSRCTQEVELLAELLERIHPPSGRRSLAPLAPLPELLREAWR